MTKILLPVDGSKHALKATRKLIELAKLLREPPEIVPLYVHLPVPNISRFGVGTSKAALQKYYEEEGRAALAPAVKLLNAAGYEARPEIKVGRVAETIVEYADKKGCDQICIGTRGMSAAANVVMGSIAARVLHSANVPVIVVR
jgi:nucleotide-binding universal stress UspA family protein